MTDDAPEEKSVEPVVEEPAKTSDSEWPLSPEISGDAPVRVPTEPPARALVTPAEAALEAARIVSQIVDKIGRASCRERVLTDV